MIKDYYRPYIYCNIQLGDYVQKILVHTQDNQLYMVESNFSNLRTEIAEIAERDNISTVYLDAPLAIAEDIKEFLYKTNQNIVVE